MPFEGESTVRELIPEGRHPARLVWLIDIGSHETEFEGSVSVKRKIVLGFEFPTMLMEDGRPFLLSREYTISKSQFGGHYIAKTSTLAKLMTSAFGATRDQVSRLGFLASALGTDVKILVEHTLKAGKAYASMVHITKGDGKCPPQVNKTLNLCLEDQIPSTLPKWILNKIESCIENKKPTPNAPQKAQVTTDKFAEEDIPF